LTGHEVKPVYLGDHRDNQLHFHQGEASADAQARPPTERDVGVG
jgi:hypothetical protein